MSVMIVVMIDNSSLNMVVVVFCAIIVFIWNIMELSMLMVFIMAMVGAMGPAFSVMDFTMMTFLMMIFESVMLVSNMPSVTVVVGVMFTIGVVFVVVITSLVAVDVSWAVCIMMCSR